MFVWTETVPYLLILALIKFSVVLDLQYIFYY